MPSDYAQILRQAAKLLASGNPSSASNLIRQRYPFVRMEKIPRRYSERDMTAVFVRDGFIDRYRGGKLVYPPALRLVSERLPEEFPYHRNWKMSESHQAYWELSATIDHVDPVTREGNDRLENWVCCSMLTNSVKSAWTLEQLGWELLPPGDVTEWDGLLGWFVEYLNSHPGLLKNPYYGKWHRAAKEHV